MTTCKKVKNLTTIPQGYVLQLRMVCWDQKQRRLSVQNWCMDNLMTHRQSAIHNTSQHWYTTTMHSAKYQNFSSVQESRHLLIKY